MIENLAPEKQSLLDRATVLLSDLPGVEAVVLGGSYARRAARETSDRDVGIYYSDSQPFAIAEIRRIAEELAAPGDPPVVTSFYEWGAWVNGGAWIHTPAGKMDFLYRSLEQVYRTIDEAAAGKTKDELDGSIEEMRQIWQSVVELNG